MPRTFYLAPRAVAEAFVTSHTGAGGWSSVTNPAPTELVLVDVSWDRGWEAREKFEAQADVLPLGDLWDPVPLAAVPVLEAFRLSLVSTRTEKIGSPKGILAV